MPKIKILASDFEGNSYFNVQRGMKGCPITRAFYREGIDNVYEVLASMLDEGEGVSMFTISTAERRVQNMFNGEEPIVDFEAEYELL